jgi:hypothetical protein
MRRAPFACGEKLGDRRQIVWFQAILKSRHVGVFVDRLGVRDPGLQPLSVAFLANL